MTDPIDSMPDDALGETFAVEVAGMNGPFQKRWIPDGCPDGDLWAMSGLDSDGCPCQMPDFAKSADAVLPILLSYCRSTRATWRALGDSSGKVLFILEPAYGIGGPGALGEWSARASCFARAACIALIRAERAQKGGA